MTDPIPAKVLQLCAAEQPQLIWTNERGGTTYRVGDRFIKWNPLTSRLDLEAYDIEPDAQRIAYYRFLWDNEDKIGASPDVTRELQTLYPR